MFRAWWKRWRYWREQCQERRCQRRYRRWLNSYDEPERSEYKQRMDDPLGAVLYGLFERQFPQEFHTRLREHLIPAVVRAVQQQLAREAPLAKEQRLPADQRELLRLHREGGTYRYQGSPQEVIMGIEPPSMVGSWHPDMSAEQWNEYTRRVAKGLVNARSQSQPKQEPRSE